MKCEKCSELHDGKYGSGRFCSCKCARAFATKLKRTEINKKVSNKLKGRLIPEEVKRKLSETLKGRKRESPSKETRRKISQALLGRRVGCRQPGWLPGSICDVSKRTARKILTRMELPCSRCGWDEGVCDLHHIVHRKDGGTDDHNNLAYVCPNCHRLIHSKKVKSEELISFYDYVGDEWKSFYYG